MVVITKRICKVWSHWGRGSREGVEQKGSVVMVNWSWRKRKFPMVPRCFYSFFLKSGVGKQKAAISYHSGNFQAFTPFLGWADPNPQMKWSLYYIVEISYSVITSIYSLYYTNPSPEWHEAFARMIAPQGKGSILTVQGPLEVGFELTLIPGNSKRHQNLD